MPQASMSCFPLDGSIGDISTEDCEELFVQAQLFAVSSDKPDVNQHTHSCSQVNT
jgi:hypothetical protein